MPAKTSDDFTNWIRDVAVAVIAVLLFLISLVYFQKQQGPAEREASRLSMLKMRCNGEVFVGHPLDNECAALNRRSTP
jgi:hypothetical protein